MVVALAGLIFILLLVFVLIIRGQSKKYAKKADSGEQTGPTGILLPLALVVGLPGSQHTASVSSRGSHIQERRSKRGREQSEKGMGT